jgi:hypothetical protein
MYEINWNELLSTVVQAVLMIVLPVLAKYVVEWLKAKSALLAAQAKDYSPDLGSAIEYAVKIAVAAAEQLGINDEINSKKEYAIDAAQRWLSAQGWEVDVELIAMAIEARVLESGYPHNQPTPEGASRAEQAQQ